jgi:hypothetical protein
MHNSSSSSLGTGILVKRVGVLWTYDSLLSVMMRLFQCFPYMNKIPTFTDSWVRIHVLKSVTRPLYTQYMCMCIWRETEVVLCIILVQKRESIALAINYILDNKQGHRNDIIIIIRKCENLLFNTMLTSSEKHFERLDETTFKMSLT